MTNLSAEAEMIEALKSIRKIAMAHPYFSEYYFRNRDMDGLGVVGDVVAIVDDECNWTTIAIEADNALRLVGAEVKLDW